MTQKLHKLIVLLFAVLGLASSQAVHAQDPRQILATMIQQAQTGTPNPYLYGVQLWHTMAAQTGNTGIYPQLVQLGPVQNIVITQQQQLPQGWLFAMTAQHMNGQSVWLIGLSSITQRIEYANFNVGATPPPLPLPEPAPRSTPPSGSTPSSGPEPEDSEACRKFPNLC